MWSKVELSRRVCAVMLKTRRFIKRVEKLFDIKIEAEQLRSGHVKIKLPNGGFVMMSTSPSCPHAYEHAERDIRKKLDGVYK